MLYGMSNYHISENTTVSVRTLSRIKNGKAHHLNLSYRNLKSIADLFDKSVEEIVKEFERVCK